jgi:TrmH family RNA methyltransferase
MTITSSKNEKLKLVRRLAEPRGRARSGMFVSEGEDLLRAGLEAGWSPELMLVAAGSGLEGTEVEPDLLDEVSTLGSGTRAIAVWRRPETREISTPCVYLAGIRDPGNVGAIVRSAVALCGGSVILGPGCADAWGPKAVRAAMGAGFASPPQPGSLGQTPQPRLALAAHGGEDLDAAIASVRPRTVCLGGEREGLDAESVVACDGVATIPILPSAESLNVAAAAAIALHRVCSAAGSPGGK